MSYLREKRESLGLTLKEVGGQVGVHFTTVADWEKKNKTPRPKNKIKLAKLYGCEVEELFFNDTEASLFAGIVNDVDSNNENSQPSPFAKFSGELQLGNAQVDCYVLDTKERVVSLRATVKAIAQVDGGGLGDYIGVAALKPYINKDLVLDETVDFNIPGTQKKGKGIPAEKFLNVCQAYVNALSENDLDTDRQKEIAIRCSILLSSCAKVGLIALIDEATGYQYERKADALQLKLKAFVADEMRAWEKTFPDELWEQFGRLTKWKGSLHSRPKWWGKLVMELIYSALDAEVAAYLKENKPPPVGGKNYHRWLTENYGLKQLVTHIFEIIGMAKTCSTIKELQEKVAYHYKSEPMQLKLFKKEILK